MMRQIVNEVVAKAPAPGNRISFARLDGVRSFDLEELYEAAARVAAGLSDLGIGPGDRIGILAANGPEWVLLDLAALRLKAVTAGFEPGKFELEPALADRYGIKVLFTDRPTGVPGAPPGVIRPISEIARFAEDAAAVAPEPRLYEPDETTTIKFTSGSTGEPKGLATTVGSIDSTVSAVQELFEHGRDDNLFVFLPLSLLQQRYWIYSAMCFGHDVTVSTYEAAFPALGKAKPTVVMGVPAFYETAMKHVQARARRAAPDGAEPEAAAAAVREAARGLFGDRIRYLWTGSAPARPAMLRFFTDAGLPIYEGYGLNETCIVAKNHPGAHREGSVGKVLARKQVVIDEDGVVNIASEYPVNSRYEFCAPGDSERMFQPGGVVRTGDLGHLDEDGFLFIHGRADDVIVLDNGKKVIVRPIEERMKADAAIEECVVYCPAQTHLVAVVSPALPVDEAAVAAHLARANAEAGRDEQITKIVVADPPFSIGNGLLTSQFKPRRKEIFELYRERLTGN